MRPDDRYRALAAPGTAELRVKGSRFLAEALPVATEEAAEAAIRAVRRREHGATHHCTAYRVGLDGLFRYNDDGEPSGTAGPPILRQIDGRAATNALVVVTRYYGGTKLGTGGLVRAYGDAASEALDAATIVTRVRRTTLCLRFGYDDTSPALQTVERFGAKVRDARYTDVTELDVAVPRSEADAFEAAFVEALAGRGRITREA